MSHSQLAHRPMSVRELADQAAKFTWNPNIGFKFWCRAAETLYQEGKSYLADRNLPQAYVVFFRYSTLVADYLSRHPEAKEPESRRLARPLQRRLERVLELLETIKPEIQESYAEWKKLSVPTDVGQDRGGILDPALAWNRQSPAQILDIRENHDLAVDLAKKEILRRRRRAGSWEADVSKQRESSPTPYIDDRELRRQMEATRHQLDRSSFHDGMDHDDDRDSVVTPTNYSYPSIKRSSSPPRYEYSSLPAPQGPRPLPPRPPKGPPMIPPLSHEKLPARPKKEPLPSIEPYLPDNALPESAPARPPKTVDKPKRVTFRPNRYLENGDPLRPVFLPRNLRDSFLKKASRNTERGLEMCGLLCGEVINNALFITHLLIPDQTCTANTCDTESEEDIWQFCDSENVIIIGWIHTHPTQTCFLSSRDLHTHAGYQATLTESVAIVCAPRFEPSWGVFRLTNPPGLDEILRCQKPEVFHEHTCKNPYVEAFEPGGHVHEANLDFKVTDLRKSV
ncbi:hypothetical protein QBC38DRAFT_54731 [Podospora fimiseda]|uniref:MPN domain-containing protein n=1 Tax=Podospora fimiseda TaxID=252190 RepID=A0AAN7GU79_9PEZI|nr:hypothetical protein QBC38DRAFT_54731 [Podospora fimiseda]